MPCRACSEGEPIVWYSQTLGIGLTAVEYRVVSDLAWFHGQTMDEALTTLIRVGCVFRGTALTGAAAGLMVEED